MILSIMSGMTPTKKQRQLPRMDGTLEKILECYPAQMTQAQSSWERFHSPIAANR